MAGPGDEVAAAGGRGGGDLRASHADREQVIGTLKVAFVQRLEATLPVGNHPAGGFGSLCLRGPR